MASYTPNLELYMKDPVADGADTFNIQTMLNENWEKIDAQVLRAMAAAAAYDAGKTYQQGDYCTQGGLLYRANQAIAQPEAWTAGHWTAISITDVIRGLTAEDVGAAPGGFGLGDPGQHGSLSDPDNPPGTGWYYLSSSTVGGDTSKLPATGFYGTVRVDAAGGGAIETAYWAGVNYEAVLTRRYNGESWESWEWVNPPMFLGVEYRTTERYNGKPVYAKLVNFGALPNATYKYVVVDNAAQVIRASGLTSDGRTLPGTVGVAQTGMITCAGVGTQVQIITYEDQSSLTATVCAWYTKTTD